MTAVSLTVKVIDKYGNQSSEISKNNRFLQGATKDLNGVKIHHQARVEDEGVELSVSTKNSRRKFFRQRQCCKKLKISSSMVLSKLYPDLIGVYENIQKEGKLEKAIFK